MNTPNNSAGLVRGKAPVQLSGVVTGVVSDNRDPKQLGRVRVKLPWLDSRFQTGWARVATPMAGDQRGLWMLPEVGDEVLLAFEHGDPERPIVMGALWSGSQKPPPPGNDDGKNNQRLIRSRSGHEVLFDDTEGSEKVVLKEKSGKATVTLDSQAGDIILEIGGQKLTLSGSGGAVTVKGDLTLTLEVKGLTVQAQEDAQVEAKSVDIQGDTGVKITCLAGVNVNDGALEVK